MRATPRFVPVLIVLLVSLLAVGLTLAQSDLPDDEPAPATPTATPQPLPDLPLESDFTYIVQPGDTLEEISALFDVRVECVRETNEITGVEFIRPGDELLISLECPAYDGAQVVEFPREDAPGSGTDGTYVVRTGDTLDTIAQRFDVSVVSLQIANDDISAADLVPGLTLTLPTDGVPYGEFPATEDASGEGGGIGGGALDGETYVIQPGDTLDVIAQNFDISIVTLRLVNDIGERERIFPGRVLFIPDNATPYGETPPLDFGTDDAGMGGGADAVAPNTGSGLLDADTYVVQRGDTLDTIAQEFDVSLVSLRIANNLENTDTILPGRVLVIPSDAPAYGEFPATDFGTADDGMGGGAEAVAPNTGGGLLDAGQYVVQRGDTLDVIAQEFDVSLESLRIANDLENTDTIFPGRVLVIPDDGVPYGAFPPTDFGTADDGMGGGNLDGDAYVVQPNDTLDTIAQAFDVSLVSLRIANDLENTDTIFPGRVLVIPSDGVPYGQVPALDTGNAGSGSGGADVYIVQVGDVLDDVAREYNVQTACLLEFNEITNSRLVQVGDQIVIPTNCPAYSIFPTATPAAEAGG